MYTEAGADYLREERDEPAVAYDVTVTTPRSEQELTFVVRTVG